MLWFVWKAKTRRTFSFPEVNMDYGVEGRTRLL